MCHLPLLRKYRANTMQHSIFTIFLNLEGSFMRVTCEELLERYRDDERIGMISGDNFEFGKVRTYSSYYFSKYAHIWCWATWRRA